MLIENVAPTSIDGIKRLAKKLKKAEGLAHHAALNKASQAASFANYAHARSVLRLPSERRRAKHQIFLTAYWNDRETREYGRETLEMWLSVPFLDICSKTEMKRARGLGWFRYVAEDHVVADNVFDRQSLARNMICQANRTTQFMEATGLKPAKHSDLRHPNSLCFDDLPRRDHVTSWIDPSTDQLIMVDEPYLAAVVDDDDRRAWANHHGWHLEASNWPGMYFPHECALFVATDASRGYKFDALMEKINAMPEPVSSENWEGDSSNTHDVFVSPAAVTRQDVRRAKAKGTIYRVSNRRTTPLSLQSARNDRKPNAIMPFHVHQEIGRAIQSAMLAGKLGSVAWSRLNALRCDLENWMFVEHDERNFQDINFTQIYYSGPEEDEPYLQIAGSRDGVVQILESVAALLKRYYPNCAPLRQVLRRVDVSVASLRK